jgi:hypothetical protein
MEEISAGIYCNKINRRWGLVPDQKLALHWDDVDKLFAVYNRIGKRDQYVKKALEMGFTEYEAVLLWQGFDRAAEQWQNSSTCVCHLVRVIQSCQKRIAQLF